MIDHNPFFVLSCLFFSQYSPDPGCPRETCLTPKGLAECVPLFFLTYLPILFLRPSEVFQGWEPRSSTHFVLKCLYRSTLGCTSRPILAVICFFYVNYQRVTFIHLSTSSFISLIFIQLSYRLLCLVGLGTGWNGIWVWSNLYTDGAPYLI